MAVQDQVNDLTPDDLVRRVYEGSPDEKRAAEALLLDGRPERTDALIAVVQRENKKKPARFGWFVAGFVALTIAIFILLTVTLTDRPNIGGFGYPIWMAAAALAATFAPTKLQKRAARALSESDDIRAVPLLIEALDKQDGATRAAAVKALTRLLPQLHASHDDSLTDAHLNILLAQMAKADDKELTSASLKALTQIGDERFLELVKSWSEGKGAAKKNAQLRDSAKDVLPYLEERIEKQKAGKTLLRAASADSADSDSLLRPAATAPESQPDTLLRPVDSDSAQHGSIIAISAEPELEATQPVSHGA